MTVRVLTQALLLATCFYSLGLADSAIHFDMPATAEAMDVTPAGFSGEDRLVSIQFDLSLIVDSLPAPQIDQLVVQVCPLGGTAQVFDYAPRTELASRFAGDIEVSRSQEVSDRVGLSLDATYGHLARGNLGMDRGEKNISSTKYNRVAPLHIVAASGTTHRGRGVYYKLRADDRQVLEGDKSFTVILKVPCTWRGELFDFRVEAEAITKSFSTSLTSLAGVAPKSQVVGTSRFIVATHLHEDSEMAKLAGQLGECEVRMRESANTALRKPSPLRTATKLSHVAFRFDVGSSEPSVQPERMVRVIDRVIFGDVDPYIDPAISQLSLPLRVAILDYLEAKRNYLAVLH